MADEKRRVTRMSHPILRLEVVGPDGVRTSDHRVFCRYQRRSVAVGTCCACRHCDEVAALPSPSVHCTVALAETELAPDPLGVRTAVGVVLDKGTIVIAPGTTVREALSLLRAEDRRSVAVVDGRHTIVGVVHEATFVPSAGAAPRERPDDRVVRIMSGSLAIHERIPVRKALEFLAAAHLREATVIDDHGVPLGVFRDVDGLRWLVEARDGEYAGTHRASAAQGLRRDAGAAPTLRAAEGDPVRCSPQGDPVRCSPVVGRSR